MLEKLTDRLTPIIAVRPNDLPGKPRTPFVKWGIDSYHRRGYEDRFAYGLVWCIPPPLPLS